MNAVITKKQKNKLMILGGIAGCFGAIAGSVGLYLRIELTSWDYWGKQWIEEFTNGYFGIMSGFSLFILGTVGYSLVLSRLAPLVFVYLFLSLSCDALCIMDILLIMPYTKDYGKYAWTEPPPCSVWNSTNNSTTIMTSYKFTASEFCVNIKIIAILFICITGALLIAFIFSLITTTVTTVALCRARAVPSAEQSTIQLAPFSTPRHFQPTSCSNTVYHTDGYRQ